MIVHHGSTDINGIEERAGNLHATYSDSIAVHVNASARWKELDCLALKTSFSHAFAAPSHLIGKERFKAPSLFAC